MFFSKDVILLNQQAKSATDALTMLATELERADVVKETYLQGILKREASFPTGLNTPTGGVAIPHTDADKVNEPQIGFMQLNEPVKFKQMGDNANVEAQLIFMLAVNDPNKQLSMLQKLMRMFQSELIMNSLKEVASIKEFKQIIGKMEIR